MEENPTQSRGTSDVEEPGREANENHYELDLDEHAPEDIDAAFQDAVAAVDRATQEEDPPESGSATESDDPGGEEAVTSADTETDVSRLEAETGQLRERLMRTLADFDNYRKRTEREKQTLRRFANFDVFKDFLGALDNLERAMESAGSAEDLKQGLKMIVRQHEEILRRHEVERIEAIGKPFDPTVHEAVGREERPDLAVPTVTREMQKGYLLHDRLLRPAMVFVAMPGGKPGAAAADGAEAVDEEGGNSAD
ncbi:MAG: nucleotide exchange factor GrpE [bacterium]|nr:nucleotide exchange factor GrpE [bacterium]